MNEQTALAILAGITLLVNQLHCKMGVQEEKQRELICYDWQSSQKKGIFSKGY